MDDAELLARYAQSRSEPAFAELVRRHVDLVYSAAWRQVEGDPHRAEEVTQMVFIGLARKASSLVRHPALLAWLHQSTRFAASNLRRDEGRRRAHERAAALESAKGTVVEDVLADWERLRPVLDDTVNELSRADREAVLMRFFANRPFAEVGQRLGLSENAARMRVERALAKLQAGLARRGITSTAAALSLALSGNAVLAAPVGVAASATGAVMAGTAGGAGGVVLWHLMSSSKLQAGIAGVLLAASAATVILQQRANARLQRDITDLGQQMEVAGSAAGLEQIVSLRSQNQRLAEAITVASDLRTAIAAHGGEINTASTVPGARKRGAAVPAGSSRVIYDATQLDQQVTPVFQPHPTYPFDLKKEGSSGQSLVELTVQPDGTVSDVIAKKSSEQGFEDAAKAAVQKWRFKPGKIAGQAVGARLQVPIIFSLQADGTDWF